MQSTIRETMKYLNWIDTKLFSIISDYLKYFLKTKILQ